MKVSELRPGMRKIDIVVKVVQKNPPREVFVKRENKYHKVANLVVGDETGTVAMSLWDDMIDQIQENDVIQIVNGYTGEYSGKIQLNIGKFGTFTTLDSTEHDIQVYLDPIETPVVSEGEDQLMKVINVLQKRYGISLRVKVIDQKETRQVITKRDRKQHDVWTFVVGDETGCIDFVLWDKGADIAVGDVIEISGGYTREFNHVLQLNLSRNGTYVKSMVEIPEETINKSRNLSEPA
ncbi:MAG: hypothetical protein ACTSRS_02325 [Candidatus Helarchaeota archaeon]